MPNQQLKFSIIFIALGAVLGWFTHSAFNSIKVDSYSNNLTSKINDSHDSNENLLVKKPSLKISSEIENNKRHFIKFLDSGQYDKALLWYKEIETTHEKYLLPFLLLEVTSLTKQSDQKVFRLLDVFLQEYYSSTTILVSKANALVSFNRVQQAFDAFFLAKSYANNNQEYNKINHRIHELSLQIYERYKSEYTWEKSIKLFSFLSESEPQYPFYQLALAESYLKVGENELAINHLQSISEDASYGGQASDMLEILLAENSNHINLEVEGGHYVVDTLLADKYKVKLMIDTGASYSSLSAYTIAQLVNDQLAEKVGQKQIYTAGGKIQVDIYKLKKMSLGYFSVSDIIVAELDLDPSLDGLLGVNFLNQFDFSVDQQNKQLILNPKN